MLEFESELSRMTMSATLGGLIKDLRIQKNISQLEIAFALGWKEPSRLSRIEQGKIESPPRFLLDNIMEAMKLSNEEKNQVLIHGNYILTQEEILDARKNIEPLIKSWKFPVTCMDYTWRILYANKHAYDVFNTPLKQQRVIEKQLPHVLQVVFDPTFILNNVQTETEKEERKQFLIRILMHFQYAQRKRTREKWYQDLVKGLMSNTLFRELWPQAQKQNQAKADIINFAIKSIKRKDGNLFQFYVFLVPLYADPRYILELHVPANAETFQYFS